MQLTRRSENILILTAFAAVCCLLVLLLGPDPDASPRARPASARIQSLQPRTPAPAATRDDDQRPRYYEPAPDLIGDWSRDIFTAITHSARTRLEALMDVPLAQPLHLSVIIGSGDRRVAIIDNQSYTTGQSVAGATIRRIGADHVVLDVSGQERVLRLRSAKIQIRQTHERHP